VIAIDLPTTEYLFLECGLEQVSVGVNSYIFLKIKKVKVNMKKSCKSLNVSLLLRYSLEN